MSMMVREMIRQRALAVAIQTGYVQTDPRGRVDIVRFNRFWDEAEEYFGKGLEEKEICRRVETVAAAQDYVNKTEDTQFNREQISMFCSEMEQTAYSLEELLQCTEG